MDMQPCAGNHYALVGQPQSGFWLDATMNTMYQQARACRLDYGPL